MSATPLKPEYVQSCNEVYYLFLPDNLALFTRKVGALFADPSFKAPLVVTQERMNFFTREVDVFGPRTYAGNPLEVAILAWFAIKPGGESLSIFSGLLYNFDASPMGDGHDRYKIVSFFAEILDTEAEISKTFVDSMVEKGTTMQDFWFSFKKPEKTNIPHTLYSFLKVCEIAKYWVGVPEAVKVEDDTFGKFAGSSMQITPKRFVNSPGDVIKARALFKDLFCQDSSIGRKKGRKKEASKETQEEELRSRIRGYS